MVLPPGYSELGGGEKTETAEGASSLLVVSKNSESCSKPLPKLRLVLLCRGLLRGLARVTQRGTAPLDDDVLARVGQRLRAEFDEPDAGGELRPLHELRDAFDADGVAEPDGHPQDLLGELAHP